MQMVFHYAQPAEKRSLGFINLGASGPQEIQLIYSHFQKSWTAGAVFLCTAPLEPEKAQNEKQEGTLHFPEEHQAAIKDIDSRKCL